MSGNEDIINRRMEETLDLFQPTAQQAEAADEMATKAAGATAPKSRKWDADNPAFSFRILSEDNDRIAIAAGDLGLTRDELARGLIGAALEALDAGQLAIDVDRETVVRETPVRTKTGQTTRRYYSTISTVKWKWADRAGSGGPKSAAAATGR